MNEAKAARMYRDITVGYKGFAAFVDNIVSTPGLLGCAKVKQSNGVSYQFACRQTKLNRVRRYFDKW